VRGSFVVLDLDGQQLLGLEVSAVNQRPQHGNRRHHRAHAML